MRRKAYRLARYLGYINVDWMLHQIDYRQFMEWLVYMELEPFDEERADYRTGTIAQILMNVNRDSKKHPEPFTVEECTPHFGDHPRLAGKKPNWLKMKSVALTAMAKQQVEMEKAERRKHGS